MPYKDVVKKREYDLRRYHKQGGKEKQREYTKIHRKKPEIALIIKQRNALPYFKEKRKQYKKSIMGKLAERRYARSEKSRLRLKARRLETRYGLSVDAYQELYKIRDGKCDICGIKKEKLDIDHCHKTNKVRGLLCGKCNRGLGMFMDNPELLEKAKKYIIDIKM